MSNTMNAAAALTITVATSGRATVRFIDAVSNKPRAKRFRTERLARIWARGHRATADYWRNSATASIADAVNRGDVVTLIAD